jgi:hypothetical protein
MRLSGEYRYAPRSKAKHMSKGGRGGRSSKDQRSDAMNPNKQEHQASHDNTSNRDNPTTMPTTTRGDSHPRTTKTTTSRRAVYAPDEAGAFPYKIAVPAGIRTTS